MRNSVFLQMAKNTTCLPLDLRKALASLCDSEGWAELRQVMHWCKCDRPTAEDRLAELARAGYLVADDAGQLFQPQMLTAKANHVTLPIRNSVRALAGNVSRRLRTEILERDGHACVYCGEVGTDKTLTIDHRHPKSRGGLTTPENLAAACKPCNQEKTDMPLADYLGIWAARELERRRRAADEAQIGLDMMQKSLDRVVSDMLSMGDETAEHPAFRPAPSAPLTSALCFAM